MTRVQTEYQLWLEDPAVDAETKKETACYSGR
ncbi:hypothetical protein QFZ77_000833 [Paenibacillus sp. V4I3]|nr:hypothetical protein [Paenibacillus sp. V4I3]